MKNIVIWGCGKVSSRFLNRYETLMQDDYNIIGYTGNDQGLEVFRGKKFYTPDSLKELEFDSILLLTTFSYDLKKEIKERFGSVYDVIIRTDVLLTLAERYKDKEKEIGEVAYKEIMGEVLKFNYSGKFVDRSKGQTKMLLVLAGYKPFLYDAVFGRIKKYLEPDIDVCIATSGKYDEDVEQMCEQNQWSYLSVEKNNVSLVQNIAIRLHPNAEYIFKLDEDMFITKGFFGKMLRAYEHALQGVLYPGIIAPTIPLNAYGFMQIIRELHLEKEYENRFGELKYVSANTFNGPYLTSVEFARFMWGEGGYVPDVDTLNEMFEKHPIQENPCPVLFNIGAILFTRRYWYQMNFFEVDDSVILGTDEQQINKFCITSSQPLMVSDNIVVGHFAFGSQTKGMKEYYEKVKFK